MKSTLLIFSALFLFTRCQQDDIPQAGAGVINQQFEIELHKTVTLRSTTGESTQNSLGTIEFSHLDESRCPANAMCMRQGAAVTSFVLRVPEKPEAQTIRMFIGDFMTNDPRGIRNRTADTVAVELANKARYQLILKQVQPYPGTGSGTPKATLLVKQQ
jgi:hypothetical protein